MIYILFLFLVIYIWSQFSIQKVRYKIKAPENLKIVQISDLHNNIFGKDQKRLLKNIKEENPDVIVMTGDIISFKGKSYNVEKLLKQLPDVKKLYITGNHEDNDIFSRDKAITLMQKYGVTVLKEDNIVINKINFFGLSDRESFDKNKYKEFNKWTILLLHRPEQQKIFKDFNYNLVLCGHMHGGQWRLPFIKEGLVSPEKKLFPKFTSGRYDISDKTIMIVSRGLGTMTWIPRIFNRPELTIIELVKESK